MQAIPLRFWFKPYRRPFAVALRTSRGVWSVREGILICLEAEDGRRGFGEIAPIEAFGTESFAGALAWCGSMSTVRSSTELRFPVRGMPCCTAALGGALGMLMESGASNAAAEEASPLPVALLVPAGAGACEAVERGAEAGYRFFKLKIGTTDFRTESNRVARVVERLPEAGRLRLDANGGLELRDAIRWLDAAADWPVEFVEQPLSVERAVDLRRLAEDHETTIALDESVRDADDVKRWRDAGWRGVFVIKPSLGGDPAALLQEIRFEPDAFVFSSALETAVGMAAGLRLGFAAGISRALGYGVGALFPGDGLGGALASPQLAREDLRRLDAEAVWDRL